MTSGRRACPRLGGGTRRLRGGARPSTRRRPRLGATAAALAVATSTLAGCASARSELGTANAACYIGLADAVAAVHHRGHLYGVRLVTVSSLEHRAPLLYAAARSTAGTKVTQVCLVAFSGTFSAAEVTHPVGKSSGHVAVVELAYPSKHLFATLLARHPPLPFGHPHI